MLATQAVLPGASVVTYWPLGLVTLVVAQYGAFLVYWKRQPPGLDRGWATAAFGMVGLILLVIAWVRRPCEKAQPDWRGSVLRVAGAMPALYILQFAARQSLNSVNQFVGNFMYGGDHSTHAELAFKFTRWSMDHDFTSPFQIYVYPSGLHFLGANISVTKGTAGLTPAGRTYLEIGRLNWLLFAAFVQLAVTALLMVSRSNRIFRLASAFACLIVLAGIPNFVFHLYLAGFLTSLGVAIVLLGLFVVFADPESAGRPQLRSREQVLLLAIALVGAAITYQPYALLPLGLLLGVIVRSVANFLRRTGDEKSTNQTSRGRSLVGASTIGAGLVPIAVYFVRGSESPSIRSLLVGGATMSVKPELAFGVGLVAVIGLWQLARARRHHGYRNEGAVTLISALWIFTASLVWIVGKTGGIPVQSQPYYTQKAMWTLLVTTAPVAMGSALALISAAFAMNPRVVLPIRLAIPLFISILPWSLSYQVDSGLGNIRSPRVQWFVEGFLQRSKTGESSIAIEPDDPQGSHIANLALRLTSNVHLPVEMSLNINVVDVCDFVREKSVDRVYTSRVGHQFLVESGCPVIGVDYVR